MEEEIEGLLKEGRNKLAFEKIVKVYSERLYWHIRRMVHGHQDADDVLQNTFIKVWKNLDKFRGDAKLYTWLYRIATNESLTFIRKQNRRTKKEAELPETNPPTLSGDIYFDEKSAEAELHKAIALLPPRQKAVFNLKYFEEMKYEDMAEVLGISIGSLKANYHHATQKVKQYLTESKSL